MNETQKEVLRNMIKVEEYHLRALQEQLKKMQPNKQRKGWVTAISIQKQWIDESEYRLAQLKEGVDE